MLWGVIDGFNGDHVCIPSHGKGEQAAQIVYFYLENHEEIRKYSAATVINDALSNEWSCQGVKTKLEKLSDLTKELDKQEALDNPALFAEHEARRAREWEALKKDCFDNKHKEGCQKYLDLFGN